MDDDSTPVCQADYLNSKDLQRLTGLPDSTWRYWAITGQGPASFKLGRRRVWRMADVLAWIAEQELATSTDADKATDEGAAEVAKLAKPARQAPSSTGHTARQMSRDNGAG